MELFRQFVILLGCWQLGELIQRLLGVPIAGNILGLLILFAGLCLRLIAAPHVEKVAQFFLRNMIFFYIPSAVSVLQHFDLLRAELWAFLGVIVVSTVVTMTTAAVSMRIFYGLNYRKRGEQS